MSDRGAIVGALRAALAILLPVECAGCGLPDTVLCPACRSQLLPQVIRTERYGIAVHCGLEYSGVARRVIGAFKDGGRPVLVGALAPVMRAAVIAALRSTGGRLNVSVELVGVPSSRSAMRVRGFRPVAMLLRRAGFRPSAVLAVHGSRVDQVGLDRHARRANLAGTLRVRRTAGGGSRRLDGRSFLVVDDILTTGATIEEAVRAISAAGGVVVAVAVLAETRLHARARIDPHPE